jgi:hypothetical protein
MVSFSQLRDTKIEELDAAWRAWRKTVERLEQAEDGYQGTFLQGVRTAKWVGRDADAARTRLTGEKSRLRAAAAESSAIASLINTAQRRFKVAQDKLKAAINTAQFQYLVVGDDGAIHYPSALPPRYKDWQQLQGVARKIQDEFKAALKEANDADREMAQALGQMDAKALDGRHPEGEIKKDAGLATRLAGFDPRNIPPKGVDTPSKVGAWWKSLPEEQRHLLMNAFPEKIGWLNGIPSEDRDEANRTYLDSRLQELESKPTLTESERRDWDRLNNFSKTLSEYEGKGRDMYLLGLRPGPDDHPRHVRMPGLDDPEASRPGPDGQFIVAFGNPDTAHHTGIYVPGTGSDLDKAPKDLHRADLLYGAANMYDPGKVSTIAWLGYDAPDRITLDATTDGYAIKGGSDFTDFVDGVRATQGAAGNSESHVTAIGHSYGSTVVGEATRFSHGLRVDDIVVAGSPGMHVSKASELGIGAHHIWSEHGDSDLVPAAGAPFLGGKTADFRDGHPYAGAVTPSAHEFGGNAMRTDTHGHGDYWNEKSESLKNQVRVMMGQYDQVTLDWGSPPE